MGVYLFYNLISGDRLWEMFMNKKDALIVILLLIIILLIIYR